MKPKRIQLRRTQGWRLPPNTFVVSRPSKWSNPHDVINGNRMHAVALFALQVSWWTDERKAEARRALRGKNLACWCKLTYPCHADVLLELANSPTAQPNDLVNYGPWTTARTESRGVHRLPSQPAMLSVAGDTRTSNDSTVAKVRPKI